MIRTIEHNDWVIFSIIGTVVSLLVMLQYLNRDGNLREFLTQSSAAAINVFQSWVIISVVLCLMLSVVLSQYIPVIPKFVERISLFGYSLNKVGYTFIIITLFYFLKATFTFIFFSSVGQDKKWGSLFFVASKFYFVFTILLIIVAFLNYYIFNDEPIVLRISLLFVAFVFIFKQFFYLFNKNKILPDQWYYKILYICTLQIAPLFALGRLLFF